MQRNYAAAAVFITCSALHTARAAMSVADSTVLLRARAADTALGCAVALVVFGLLSRKSPAAWLPTAPGDVPDAAAAATDQLTPLAVASPAGLAARRDLLRQVIRLSENVENGVNGFPAQRAEALQIWPVVVAAERIAYRGLGEGWRLEEVVRDQAENSSPGTPRWRAHRRATACGRSPTRCATAPDPGCCDAPSLLSRDVADLRRALQAR